MGQCFYMEGIERFGDYPKIPDDIEVEGLVPTEVNLASAEQLIAELEGKGNEISLADREEAQRMIAELTNQKSFFESNEVQIVDAIDFAIGELTRLTSKETLSVGELIALKEKKPSANPAAEEARRELEELAN
jgi:hypothetical protein